MGIMLTKSVPTLTVRADHPDIPLVMVVINESAGMINREANGGRWGNAGYLYLQR